VRESEASGMEYANEATWSVLLKKRSAFYVGDYLDGLEEVISSHLGHAVVGEHHVDGLLLQNGRLIF
jgi:hypothetical protein